MLNSMVFNFTVLKMKLDILFCDISTMFLKAKLVLIDIRIEYLNRKIVRLTKGQA